MRNSIIAAVGALALAGCTDDADPQDTSGDTSTDTSDDTSDTTDTEPVAFDVTFSGTGYGADAGKPVHYALADATARTVVATADGTVPTDGSLSASFPAAITSDDAGLSIVWYIDVNDIGGCQDPGDLIWGDDLWAVAVPDHATSDQLVTYDYTSDYTAVCWAFNQM